MLDADVPLAGCNTEHPHHQRHLVIPHGMTAYGQMYRWDFATQRCRQLGRYDHDAGQWVDLRDCRGCRAERDVDYIRQGRADLDQRAGRG